MSENAPFRNVKASEKKEVRIHTRTGPLSKFLAFFKGVFVWFY